LKVACVFLKESQLMSVFCFNKKKKKKKKKKKHKLDKEEKK